MARYCSDSNGPEYHRNRGKELAFADSLDRLSRDIRSGRVRLIEADYRRETHTEHPSVASIVAVTRLTGEETLSVRFHRSSQEEDQ